MKNLFENFMELNPIIIIVIILGLGSLILGLAIGNRRVAMIGYLILFGLYFYSIDHPDIFRPLRGSEENTTTE